MKPILVSIEHTQAGANKPERAVQSDSLRNPYIAKLGAVLFFILGSVTAFRLMTPNLELPSIAGHLLLEACSALMACGVIYCLWVQYCVATQRWILLTTIAFTGLMIGQVAHVVTVAFGAIGYSALERLGFNYYYAWQIACASLLIAAARSDATDSRENCRREGLRMLAGWLILSVCLTATVLQIRRSWPTMLDTVSATSVAVLKYLGAWSYYPLIARAIAVALFMIALLAFARRYARDEDPFTNGMVCYLVCAVSGQSALLISARNYDSAWWTFHVLGIAGLSMMLAKMGSQFGASYSDAHARIEHLEAVHRLSSSLTNTLDLRVVLLALVSDAASMLSARFASVMLADPDGQTLTTVVTHGLPEMPLGPSQPQPIEGSGRPAFYSGHTARAFRERRICVVDDVYTDVEFVPWRQLAKHDGYAVSVPLIYQELPLGIMNLFFDKHIPLNDERIRLYQTLASSAAVAIANAQLYEKMAHAETAAAFRSTHLRLAS